MLLLCDPSFQDAFLALARHRSPKDEPNCRALLDLLETCQVLDRALRLEHGASGLTESRFQVLARLIPMAPGMAIASPVLLEIKTPALWHKPGWVGFVAAAPLRLFAADSVGAQAEARLCAKIRFPFGITGALSQGTGGGPTREAMRFVVNTIGDGGLFKSSDPIFVLAAKPTQDLGQLPAQWGSGAGYYLVLTIFGLTTLRRLAGSAVDVALTPTCWRSKSYDERETQFVGRAADFVRQTPALLDGCDAGRAGAIDPYVAVREACAALRAAEAQW